MNLADLGWNPAWDAAFSEHRERGRSPARIAREERGLYLTYGESGELPAEVAGKMRFEAAGRGDFPAVGDWVALESRPAGSRSTIHAILPRQSKFSRKVAGALTEEQVLAANVTHVFLVSGLDGDFNPRRIERYLTLAWDSGAAPIIVLNKMDVCEDLPAFLEETEGVALGVPILPVSGVTGAGLEALRALVTQGRTVAFLGSSGVGKSTLINALLGEERQAVQKVRADDSRGRHTTTRRELFVLPGGGVLIDTPGMRELQLWADEESLASAFADVETFAKACRFNDCRHDTEPGCAVRAAIQAGELDADRLDSYFHLQRELRHLARKEDARQRGNSKARSKGIAKAIREHFRQSEKY